MPTKQQKNRLLIAQEAYTIAQEEWQTASAKYYEARRKYMKLLDEKYGRDNEELSNDQ